jgi:hypothetical protein
LWAEDAERKTTAKTTAIESVALPAGFAPAFGRVVTPFGVVFFEGLKPHA